MIKRLSLVFILLSIVTLNGCTCNKSNLIFENEELIERNEEMSENIEELEEIKSIYNWYNNIATDSINSFVLVESKSNFTKYSDGVVISNSGLEYYVITDYNKIKQEGITSYRVMASNAIVYDADIAQVDGNVIYDEYSGLVLLRVYIRGYYNNVSLNPIKFGNISKNVGHISNIEHNNKIQIRENIKTSQIIYNEASYDCYNDVSLNQSGSLINVSNQLVGFYSSSISSFVSSEFIKDIVRVIYLQDL